MLEEMRIRGLGVIDDALLEFGPALTVVTGETGAGKTMVVQGLALLFGGRADPGRVRPGQPRATVEGRLVLPLGAPVLARAEEAGAVLDDGALLVSRTVSVEGRSRAHLGGAAVPVALLTELAEELVAVHGQSDQHRLMRPAVQRAALDRFAGPAVGELLDNYQTAYHRHGVVAAELAELAVRSRERVQEADLLRHGLAEVTAAQPQPGEDAALDAEIERLAHAEALGLAAAGAHAALAGDPAAGEETLDVGGLLAAARVALDGAADHDPVLRQLADRARELGFLTADLAADLAAYAGEVEADPARLAAAQQRLSVLNGLTRRFAPTVGEVLEWAERAEMRLVELDGDGDRGGALAAEQTSLEATLTDLAGQVSAARAAAALKFATATSAELADLAMPHAAMSVHLGSTEVPADQPGLLVGERRVAFGPAGVDDVELRLRPHPGAPDRPLAKGASGGELSRVMLAVEVVFAGADPVPTLVFDEVDAGVGGRAAVEVGRRLARLARAHQVVVVTHLPQVAAFADRHLLVVKDESGAVTRSGVVRLEGPDRVTELSRMLAGVEESALARGHAEELLAAAAGDRVGSLP